MVSEILDFFEEYEKDIEDAKYILESALLIQNNDKDLFWVTEASKTSKIKGKISSAVKKVRDAVSKLVSFLQGKIISTIERKKSDREFMKKQFELKGQSPNAVKRILDKQWDQLMKAKDNFMKQTGFGKVSIPFANAVGWGPLVFLPGSVAILLGASSLIDFILDYKRMFLGERKTAIENFSKWLDDNTNKLEETEIYAADKIMSRFVQHMSNIGTALKNYSLVLVKQSAKGVEKGSKLADKGADKLKNEKAKDKIKSIAKKTSKTSSEIVKKGNEVNSKYKDMKKLEKKKQKEGKIKRGDRKRKEQKINGREWVYEYQEILEDIPLFNLED